MSELFLYIPENLSAPWHWVLPMANDRGLASTPQQKNEIYHQTHTKLIVIIAGIQVTAKQHALGNLNRKHLKQAVGFSVEDELAVSLDETHFSFDADSDRFAVIAKSTLHTLIDELANIDLFPDEIYADYDSVDRDTSFLVDGYRISSRKDGLGHAVENGLAAHIEDENTESASMTTASFLELAAKTLNGGHMPINLRQGEFSKHTKFAGGQFKRSAWLAAACLVLFIGFNLGQGLVFQHKANAVKTEIDGIYAQIFPGQNIPKNPVLPVLKAQAEQKVIGGEMFIRLSSILANSVQDVEGIELVSLGYDQGRSQISLSILYNSFDDVERLKTAVTRHGGAFVESGTRQGNAGLVGDAVLRVAS